MRPPVTEAEAESEACSPVRCRGDDGVAQATLLCSCLPQDWLELLPGWCVRPPVTTVTYFHLSAENKNYFLSFPNFYVYFPLYIVSFYPKTDEQLVECHGVWGVTELERD